MGGTMVLPGSHLRRVNESDDRPLPELRRPVPTVCPAGSLLVCHHGLWHCGQPNLTRRAAPMLKLRLNPGAPAAAALGHRRSRRHRHRPGILGSPEPWHGNEARLEVVNRIRLWRHLTGDARFDVDYWLTRLENDAS